MSKFILFLVSSFCILFHAPFLTYAEQLPSMAPLNPEFVNFMDAQQKMVQPTSITLDGHALGYIPSPIDESYMKGISVISPSEFERVFYAVSFDLRLQSPSKLTAVRDQGTCGDCWAFATYSSLESNLLPTENLDFSENNLKNNHGFDWGHCDGGNHKMSTAYLARWAGPVYEADDIYNVSSNISPLGLTPGKHVQKVLFLPARANLLDNDNIKWAITTYGALKSSMFWDDASYSSANFSYYYNGGTTSNHAIAIVGWDDNYSRNNFNTTPAVDGAFIIRNSWGSGWGQSGYFYISYYDTVIGSKNAVFVNAESTTNYARVYQYDPLGHIGNYGYESSATAWFSNIFTAETSGESIKAVSFYVNMPNSTYDIYVYKNVTGTPTSGNLATSQTNVSITQPGYHTVTLDTSVPITNGENFSVVVKATTLGYNYPIPIEYAQSSYSSLATASPGQSYISSNGVSWTDITTACSATTNVCLKAFTITTPTQYTLTVTKAGTGTGNINATGCTLNWVGNTGTCSANSGASISLSGVANTGSTWIGWDNGTGSAASCAGTANCNFNLTSNSGIRGTFDLNSISPKKGDINGDGYADILWQNTDNTAVVWFMNSSGAVASTAGLMAASNWKIAGNADINGDGFSDILWQNNADNTAVVWFMNSTGWVTSTAGLMAASTWKIAGTGDINGDGFADILWQNTDNTATVWFMNSSGGVTSTAGLRW